MKLTTAFNKYSAIALGVSAVLVSGPASAGFAAKLAAAAAEGLNGPVFEAAKAPETDAQKRAVLAAPTIEVDGVQSPIGFHTILRSGDTVGGGTFGQLINHLGEPILLEDGSPRISNDNDFSSLLQVDGGLFMVSHFESRPGAMYLTELRQDPGTGLLSAVRTRPLDFSGFRGGWVHCAGSVTPWNTHLGSEEYEPYADQWDITDLDDYYVPMADYYDGDLAALNPYDYGWQVEVRVEGFDSATSVKHYAMGRVAHELAYVLPDRQTAYISDDGTNIGLFRFVADQPEDLSSGTLYVAKWNQTGTENGGSADLDWISLGHATDAEIRAYIDQGIQFDDIFEKTTPNEDGTCPSGFTSINAGHDEVYDLHQCLRLMPGMEKAASRLETRRYAAMLGGTTEFRKMEGITHDPDRNVLYIGMSEIEKGMEDNMSRGASRTTFDVGGPNDIRVPYNRCGGVYALDLDESYVAKNMYGVVLGRMTQAWDAESDLPAYDSDGPFAKNKCDIDGIANPDNLTFMPGHNLLIIGEDTGDGHQNDMIWAYHINGKTLTRIQTTPYGSETTSPYFYPNINGWGYLMSVIQHPYGESDSDQQLTADEGRAYTGYIGPLPALD